MVLARSRKNASIFGMQENMSCVKIWKLAFVLYQTDVTKNVTYKN